MGRNGLVFTIYKIRTMYHDSEPEGARWCVPGDLRVTPIGRLLRCTHVDELPQLIQVLQGKMSLIGPRPDARRLFASWKGLYRAIARRV